MNEILYIFQFIYLSSSTNDKRNQMNQNTDDISFIWKIEKHRQISFFSPYLAHPSSKKYESLEAWSRWGR
ncbi:hypothetical protein RchiOBHm_Chr4g0445301 [Rosa chinensis]|uniref:Uncharacterized protein n=1 Tax=Rosa chinensis TaxID=74649 RepID=A0A2P6R4K5_ROSCH|nr:hypothetical protein RchiOBHm_Chr4g0445301 [Rosa chinensis]